MRWACSCWRRPSQQRQLLAFHPRANHRVSLSNTYSVDQDMHSQKQIQLTRIVLIFGKTSTRQDAPNLPQGIVGVLTHGDSGFIHDERMPVQATLCCYAEGWILLREVFILDGW